MTAAKRNLSARIAFILHRLRVAYPQATCALTHQNPLQLLVATILSAQCTDERVNQVTPRLFARYRSAADFAQAPPGELEMFIRPTGFFRNKARSIRRCCRVLVEKHQGQVPAKMDDLLLLDGIGRKTANVVLGVAFGIADGIVVDTHVKRLSRRFGLTKAMSPEQIERDLMAIVPVADWIDWSHLLIWHGRRRCPARRPDCGHCELATVCAKIGVNKNTLKFRERNLIMKELQVGDKAPTFLELSANKGSTVVIYFYPKDFTPGCTTQACEFRDLYSKIQEQNAVVIGISPDAPESHERFIAEFGIPYILVADTDHAIAEAYGVWKQKNLYGKKTMGIERSTFVINPDGTIKKIFRRVKPQGHATVVMESLQT